MLDKHNREYLIENGYDICKDETTVVLYRDETKSVVWESMCKIVGASVDADAVRLVVVAQKEE